MNKLKTNYINTQLLTRNPSKSSLVKILEILSKIITKGQTEGDDLDITRSIYEPGREYLLPYKAINTLRVQLAAINTAIACHIKTRGGAASAIALCHTNLVVSLPQLHTLTMYVSMHVYVCVCVRVCACMHAAVICSNSNAQVPGEQCAIRDTESKQDMTCECGETLIPCNLRSLSPLSTQPPKRWKRYIYSPPPLTST